MNHLFLPISPISLPLIICRYPFYWIFLPSVFFWPTDKLLARIKLNEYLFCCQRCCCLSVISPTLFILRVCKWSPACAKLLNSTLIDHMGDRNAISCSSSIETTLVLLLMIYFDRIGFWCRWGKSRKRRQWEFCLYPMIHIKCDVKFLSRAHNVFSSAVASFENSFRSWLIYVMQRFSLPPLLLTLSFVYWSGSLRMSIYIYMKKWGIKWK